MVISPVYILFYLLDPAVRVIDDGGQGAGLHHDITRDSGAAPPPTVFLNRCKHTIYGISAAYALASILDNVTHVTLSDFDQIRSALFTTA